MEIIIQNKCEACDGTGCQVQDEGALMGMTRPCPECAPNYTDFIRRYGTDPEENPLIWIDHDKEGKQMIKKITEKDRKRNYLILPDGTEREISINL